jgi:hypothetical protein
LPSGNVFVFSIGEFFTVHFYLVGFDEYPQFFERVDVEHNPFFQPAVRYQHLEAPKTRYSGLSATFSVQ